MADEDLSRVIALVDGLQRAVQRADRTALKDSIVQLVAQRAPIGGQWHEVGQLAASIGEHGLALQAIDLFVDFWGGRPSAQFKKAEFLGRLNDWPGADALLETIPENVPDTAGNIQMRATAALNLGRIDAARGYLERLIRMRPLLGSGWYSLAMTVDFAQEPGLAQNLIDGASALDGEPAWQRALYHYALGKALADRGEHALAFEAVAAGAREMKTLAVYDHDAHRATAARALEGHTADRIAEIASRQCEPTARTIFVTGLPRSGTTLVEQILTSHSEVSDGGEIARIYLLADEVGGTDWASLSRHVETAGVGHAAQLWDHWLDELYPGPERVVDKTLEMSRFLGLAAALLPEAPIIWMTRDPLDCAWSCFRTAFAGTSLAWSYDLKDIAAHFRLEDGLLAQWRNLLGERLLIVPYEELVTQPEAWIRRILAHAGLGEEPQVFAPHENRRSVMSASMVQVRRPINRAGIGAAAPYREFLGPFIDAYRS